MILIALWIGDLVGFIFLVIALLTHDFSKDQEDKIDDLIIKIIGNKQI